jgi:hypothetical protein
MPSLNEQQLKNILKKNNLELKDFNVFFETGSHIGETINNMLDHFEKLITIEVSEKYYNIVKNKFKDIQKVKCVYGDSALIMEDVIPTEREGVIFWLDGHYSSDDTGKGINDCPLIEELNVINSKFKNSVIIIDDYRMFGTKGNEDWTNITQDNVIKCFDNKKIKDVFSIDDRLIIFI